MDGVVGLKNKFVNEIIFSKVTLTMWTLLCPIKMKTLPVGPQLRGSVGVLSTNMYYCGHKSTGSVLSFL
jgi:hypothetical protein